MELKATGDYESRIVEAEFGTVGEFCLRNCGRK